MSIAYWIQRITDWSRSEIMAAVAIVISIGSALFSFLQWRIARRREKADVDAKSPTVEPRFQHVSWPGWHKIILAVRNRDAAAIRCTGLKVKKPNDVTIVCVDTVGYRSQWGSFELPDTAPTEKTARSINLDQVIARAGSEQSAGLTHMVAADVRHLEFLIRRSSAAPSKTAEILEMSLRTERTSDSVPYKAVPIVTRMPMARTETET